MAELLCKGMSRADFCPAHPCKAFFGVPIEAADDETRKIRAPEGAKQRGFRALARILGAPSSPKLCGSGKHADPVKALRAARDLLRRSQRR
jgi:hypothetical protein